MKAPRKSRGSVFAKLGKPAKAGRRKQYGHGSKRKTKDFGQGDGFVIASMNGGPVEHVHLTFKDQWKSGQSVMVPRDHRVVGNRHALTDVEMQRRIAAVQKYGAYE